MNREEIIVFISAYSTLICESAGIPIVPQESLANMLRTRTLVEPYRSAVLSFMQTPNAVACMMLYVKNITIERERRRRVRRSPKAISYDLLAGVGDYRRFIEEFYIDPVTHKLTEEFHHRSEVMRETLNAIIVIEHFGVTTLNTPLQADGPSRITRVEVAV